MESVSIVNNGSKVTEKWMSEYAYYLDIMAVSCDSFDGETNKRIGRYAKVSIRALDIVSRYIKAESQYPNLGSSKMRRS